MIVSDGGLGGGRRDGHGSRIERKSGLWSADRVGIGGGWMVRGEWGRERIERVIRLRGGSN